MEALGLRLIAETERLVDQARAELVVALGERLVPDPSDGGSVLLDEEVSASVVVATFDRPDELRQCLRCLTDQIVARRLEVIVVDNHPGSGLTAPVVAEFPGVLLVREPRKGLSYARNAGIDAATGDVIVMTDDDVRAPSDWVENLVAPLGRRDVVAVTGNVLPLELDTPAQLLFESYGGLGRGFERREYDGRWFESWRSAVPTWVLGGTANAAFLASLFHDPQIGMLEESLGAGMPAAVGEDTYLFYKILKAGHTIVYEPAAVVWHRHRSDMLALRRQLYGYSKGHVAYHLTTLLDDKDLRALLYLGIRLPGGHVRRLVQGLRSDTRYPVGLNLLEIAGNLAGPLAWLESRRRVKREGRSGQVSRSSARKEL